MRVLHAIAAKLLVALIVLHIAAALWHQFVRRDGLLRRMGFGIHR
jgi:cytochrome b561